MHTVDSIQVPPRGNDVGEFLVPVVVEVRAGPGTAYHVCASHEAAALDLVPAVFSPVVVVRRNTGDRAF